MPRRVHLVVDTGVDDALAIVAAWVHPDLELAAVTATAGNVPLSQAVANTRHVLDTLGAASVPVTAGAALRGDGRPFRHRDVHGPDGLAGLVGRVPPQEALAPRRAALDVDSPGALLVCLAPLTTLLHAAPRVVLATYARPGEANHAMDAAAADTVRAAWLVRDANTSGDLSGWVPGAGRGSAVADLVDGLVRHQHERGAGLGDGAAVLRLAGAVDPAHELAALLRP